MCNKKIVKILALCLIVGFISPIAFAANKDSNDFQYKYEGDLLPSDVSTSPQWERVIAGGVAFESYYCDATNGILTVDTVKGPSATESAFYYIPGQYSAFLQDAATYEFYTYEDPDNPWDPNMEVGYTVEVKFRMDSIQIPDDPTYPDGKFAFWLHAREGLHGQISSCQVFTDKIVLTNTVPAETIYAGDLTDKFYTLRIVRNPGAVEVVSDVYDFYLDGILVAEDMSGVNAAYNQDEFWFGDAAESMGGTDIKVEIDYVRLDLTGAYKPPYLIGDINEDGVVDIVDFAALAQTWTLFSDPDVNGYVDCTDPANAEICQ